jgi:hypothetical protein
VSGISHQGERYSARPMKAWRALNAFLVLYVDQCFKSAGTSSIKAKSFSFLSERLQIEDPDH